MEKNLYIDLSFKHRADLQHKQMKVLNRFSRQFNMCARISFQITKELIICGH